MSRLLFLVLTSDVCRRLLLLFHSCEHRHCPHVEAESRLAWIRPRTARFISTPAVRDV